MRNVKRSDPLEYLIHYISRKITGNLNGIRSFSSQPKEISMNSYNERLENDDGFTDLTILHPGKRAEADSGER